MTLTYATPLPLFLQAICALISKGSELNFSSVHMERQEEIPTCHKATPFKYGEEDSKSKISNLTESDER